MGKPFIIYRNVDVTNIVDTVVNELNRNGISCELEPPDTETSDTYNSYTIRFQKTWARMTFTIPKAAKPTTSNTVGIDISNKSGYRPITKKTNISMTSNMGGSVSNLSLSILRNTSDFWIFNIYIHNVSLPGPSLLGSTQQEISIGRIPVKKGDITTNEFICSTDGLTFYMFKDVDEEREYEFSTGDIRVINAMNRYAYLPQEDWDLFLVPAVSYSFGAEGVSFTTVDSVELPGFRTVWGIGSPAQRPLSVNGDTWYRLTTSSYLAVKLHPEETV